MTMTHEPPAPQRTVTPEQARAVSSWVGFGLSEEDAMRILFPEEAAKIYDAGRWPWSAL
jgi:hypothetical protein